MRLVIAVAAIVAAAALGTASAQMRIAIPISGTIRVIGDSLDAHEVIRVTLDSSGVPVREAFTRDGQFVFANVAPGSYTITVHDQQFEEVRFPVVVPSDVEVFITLRRRAPAGAQSPTASIFALQVPKSARSQFRIAQAAAKRNDCAGAIGHLEKALEIYGKYADAHNAAGACYVMMGTFALAEESFKRAIELTADAYPALNLADLLINQGRLAEAENVLTEAIHRNPADGMGAYGLAALRLRQDRLDEAEELALAASKRSGHVPDVHLILAKVYDRMAKSDLAVRELKSYVNEAKPGPTRNRIRQLLEEELKRSPSTRVPHYRN